MSNFENFRVDPLTGKLTMTVPVTGGTELQPTVAKTPSPTVLESPTNTTTTIVVTDGASVVGAAINQSGRLILTYSDSSTEDLGVVTAAGTPGTNGKTVLSGAGVPSGSLGSNGDFYIDTTAKAIYGPKGTPSAGWNTATSLIGPSYVPTKGTIGADATDLATALTLVNQLRAVLTANGFSL